MCLCIHQIYYNTPSFWTIIMLLLATQFTLGVRACQSHQEIDFLLFELFGS